MGHHKPALSGVMNPLPSLDSSQMDTIEDVDMDSDSTFKYILIKISTVGDKPSSKLIVRGYSWAAYHGEKRCH